MLGLDVERNIKIHHVKRFFGASFLLGRDLCLLWRPGMSVRAREMLGQVGSAHWALTLLSAWGAPRDVGDLSGAGAGVCYTHTCRLCRDARLCVQYPHVPEHTEIKFIRSGQRMYY